MSRVTEVKEIMTQQKVEFEKSIKKENEYKKNLEDAKSLKAYVEKLISDSTPLPPDSPYKNYEEWKSDISKDIVNAQNGIDRIAREKNLLECINYYLENVTE